MNSKLEKYNTYVMALLDAEKDFEVGKENWYIGFDEITGDLSLYCHYAVVSQGTMYLGTDKKKAQKFLDKWHKQILEYEFGYLERKNKDEQSTK